MKNPLIVAGIAILIAIAFVAVRYLLARRIEKKVEATGTVVYAVLLASEPAKVFGKLQADFVKMTLRVQDPGSTETREVKMSTRVPSNQRLEMGMRFPVMFDPAKPDRVYPASVEAAKRAVMTGPRNERRMMQSQLRSPRKMPQQNQGYIPPNMGRRR